MKEPSSHSGCPLSPALLMHGHLILASTAISGQTLCPQSCPVQGTHLVLNSFFFAGHLSSSIKSPLPAVALSGTESHVFTPQFCTWNPASLSAAGPRMLAAGRCSASTKEVGDKGPASPPPRPHSQGSPDYYSSVLIHHLLILAGDRKMFQCLKHPLVRVIFITRKFSREDR